MNETEPRTPSAGPEPRASATGERRPSSPRKIASARANGPRSRGPNIAEGEARSSLNSLKHGLTAETVVLANEDPRQLEMLRAAYLDYFSPRNAIEPDLVDEWPSPSGVSAAPGRWKA